MSIFRDEFNGAVPTAIDASLLFHNTFLGDAQQAGGAASVRSAGRRKGSWRVALALQAACAAFALAALLCTYFIEYNRDPAAAPPVAPAATLLCNALNILQ